MLIKRLSGAALGAAAAIGVGLSVLPAHAQFVVTLRQEGSDVVATGSGSIDTTGLRLLELRIFEGGMTPSLPAIQIGPLGLASVYEGVITGPLSFGIGTGATADSNTGDRVGIIFNLFPQPVIVAPPGYVSGNPLSDTMTFDDATFESLGVTPGVYTWTWTPPPGLPAAPDGSFTLDAVPEPSTWIMMLAGFAGLGLAGWRARPKTMGRAARSLR
jgi:hypothetical protein